MSDVVAVDLGGTNIRVARVDADGKIIARDKIPTLAAEGMTKVVERIAGLVSKLRSPETIGVGIGTPGVPDHHTGVMTLPAVNIPGSLHFPLSGAVAELTGLPVSADNDGNLAALGEYWLGAGQGEPVVIIFTLGTGIGGGLILDGEVYHGYKNLGTEFGHLSIDNGGRPCSCGSYGCVEQYASASAVGRDARFALRGNSVAAKHSQLLEMCGGVEGIDKVDARMVFEAADNGDDFACFIVDRACHWLASGIGSMINALNPSCVIIGGGMSLAGEALRSRVERELNLGRAFGPTWLTAKLRMAQLGDDAGILGAARMALKKYSKA